MIKLPEAGKVVSILSGGMDSSIMTILLTKHYGAENVYPISFDYNQKQVVEIDRAKAQLDYLNSHLELGDSMVEVTDPITGEKTKEVVDMRARLSLIIDPKLLQDWTIYKAARVPQAE